MNMTDAEFIVSGIVSGESGQLHVIGRCGEKEIFVGDLFRSVFRVRKSKYPSEMGDAPIREPGEHKTALQVKCIHAYGKSLHELGAGMTASLALVGDGVEYVAPGVVLGQPTPNSVETPSPEQYHA